jgi:hypothetical protein
MVNSRWQGLGDSGTDAVSGALFSVVLVSVVKKLPSMKIQEGPFSLLDARKQQKTPGADGHVCAPDHHLV